VRFNNEKFNKMKYTEQNLKDEYEQAVKRKGKLYAEGYVEGLKDAQNQALTIPVVVNCKHEDYTPCYGREGELMFKQCDTCGQEFD
jgi:hypothetical protein